MVHTSVFLSVLCEERGIKFFKYIPNIGKANGKAYDNIDNGIRIDRVLFILI